MQTCTLHDLTHHRVGVMKPGEPGELTVVTDRGQPLFVAVPFDDLLLDKGVRLALAVRLFEAETLSTGQAARFSGVSLAEFLEACSGLGIPVVRYPPEELEMELEVFDELHRR